MRANKGEGGMEEGAEKLFAQQQALVAYVRTQKPGEARTVSADEAHRKKESQRGDSFRENCDAGRKEREGEDFGNLEAFNTDLETGTPRRGKIRRTR